MESWFNGNPLGSVSEITRGVLNIGYTESTPLVNGILVCGYTYRLITRDTFSKYYIMLI